LETPVQSPARSTPPVSAIAGAPLTPVERLVITASREVKVLAALTPVEAQRERARLVGELRAGRRPVPSWTYAPWKHGDLRRALDAAGGALTASAETPMDALYLGRIRELSLEASLCERAGRSPIAALARSRFEPADPATAAAASALCASWLDEPAAVATGPLIASDDPDPRSLLSRMRTAVSRLRLPFRVVASPSLAPLAAIGERVILVATGRLLPEEDALRTVLHEVEGHARPRTVAELAGSVLFEVGTARGIDDQEGRALLLEERAGLLGPRRRRQLAARHRAVEAMLDGASFADVAEMLATRHGVDAGDAVVVAERAFRGGDGTLPGLGRERIYLEAFVRVRAHLAARPGDERILASGQVALESIEILRALAPDPPSGATAARPAP
jgi:hypothetical protein